MHFSLGEVQEPVRVCGVGNRNQLQHIRSGAFSARSTLVFRPKDHVGSAQHPEKTRRADSTPLSAGWHDFYKSHGRPGRCPRSLNGDIPHSGLRPKRKRE